MPMPTIELAGANAATCKTCLICWQAETPDQSDFCSDACTEVANKRAPFLLEIPRGHVAFKKGKISSFSKSSSSQNFISLRYLHFRMEKCSNTMSRNQESVHGRDETRLFTQIRGVQVRIYLFRSFSVSHHYYIVQGGKCLSSEKGTKSGFGSR